MFLNLSITSLVVLIAALLMLLLLSFAIFASANVCSQIYLKTLCKGKRKRKQIAISFDDGPHPEITPRIHQLLEKHAVPATFFCKGFLVNAYPKIVKAADDAGHIIGNHSYKHGWNFGFLSRKKVIEELNKTNSIIQETIGKKPQLFRPPFGVTNPPIARAVRKLKMQAVGWSVRSLDTSLPKDKVLEKVNKKISEGAVFLFHDNQKNTPEILEDFLQTVKEKGFTVVSLPEILEIKAYANS